MAPADPITTRLQERLEALEAQPPQPTGRRPDSAPPAGPAESVDVADLNQQLEILREQLEEAFTSVEARLDAAIQRAVAAEARAEAADTRARMASAQAASVLSAVEALASELPRIAELGRMDARHVLGAVDRLRARFQPT